MRPTYNLRPWAIIDKARANYVLATAWTRTAAENATGHCGTFAGHHVVPLPAVGLPAVMGLKGGGA